MIEEAILNKPIEFEISKEQVQVEDFEKLLTQLTPGGEHVLDFSRTKNLHPSSDAFKSVLDQMIQKSGRMILLGPSCFLQLVDHVNDNKFHFVLKSNFEPTKVQEKNLITRTFKMCEEYWLQFLPELKKVDQIEVSDLFAQTIIEMKEGNITHTYLLAFSPSALKIAIEQLLMIPVDTNLEDYKEFAAEILNMFCGHLKAKLREDGMNIQFGIPENFENSKNKEFIQSAKKVFLKFNDSVFVFAFQTR